MSENNNTFNSYLGPDFQLKLVWQILVEPEFAEKVISDVHVEYFDDPYLKKLYLIIQEYYSENGKVVNLYNNSIYQAIKQYKSGKQIDKEILEDKIKHIKLWDEKTTNRKILYDGDVVRKDAFNFIKQQEFRKVAEDIISNVKNGGIKQPSFIPYIETKFSNINNIGDDNNYGVDVVDDIEDVLIEDFRESIPTGIELIDELTDNGLGKGEIGLILAPSGIGKTTALTKIANTAYVQGKKVLQIVFEDTEKQIQRKHFALFSGIKLSEFKRKENREIIKRKVVDANTRAKNKGGKLDIIQLSEEGTTIHGIRSWVDRQEKKFGYKYDEIVIDYLDCLEPNNRENDLHSSELSIIKSFGAMATDYDIPCWSAIQTNRNGFNTEFVNSSDAGGNIKRIQKAHFVMSIAKPNKDENPRLANIKINKARFVEDGQEFKDCIFDNDSLEIKITDHRALDKIRDIKYSDTDVDKFNDSSLNDINNSDNGGLKLNDNIENVVKNFNSGNSDDDFINNLRDETK